MQEPGVLKRYEKITALTILFILNCPGFATDNSQKLIRELEDSFNLCSKVVPSKKQRFIYDPGHPLSVKGGLYRGYIISNYVDMKKLFKRIISFLRTKNFEREERNEILKTLIKYRQFHWKKILINRKNILMHNKKYYRQKNVYKKKYAYIRQGELIIRNTLSKYNFTIESSQKETVYRSNINLINEVIDFMNNCNIYNYLNEAECIIRAGKCTNKISTKNLNLILKSYLNKYSQDYIYSKNSRDNFTKDVQNYFRHFI